MKTQLVLDALNMAIHRRQPIDVVHRLARRARLVSGAWGAPASQAPLARGAPSASLPLQDHHCELQKASRSRVIASKDAQNDSHRLAPCSGRV
jgi:hypothetical protein